MPQNFSWKESDLVLQGVLELYWETFEAFGKDNCVMGVAFSAKEICLLEVLFATVSAYEMEDYIFLKKSGPSFFEKLVESSLAADWQSGIIVLTEGFWLAKSIYEKTGHFRRI